MVKNRNMSKQTWKTYYPLLLGIYPAVGLISVNISQMNLVDGLRSVMVVLVFSLAVYGIISWRIQDVHKAALLSLWFMVFFFAYGHVYGVIWGKSLFGFELGRHRFLFPLWLVVFGVGGWLLYKKANHLKSFSRGMNIVSIILLVIPMFQIGVFQWQRYRLVSGGGNMSSVQWNASAVPAGQLPDVYYIILDGYSRDDMLLKNYNLDISNFIGQLEEIGFYVPRCSQSNYGLTGLSLASSLNMNTVDQILPQAILQHNNWVSFSGVIKHSLVRQLFESMGYKTVSFQNGIWWSEWTDANYFITDANGPVDALTNFRQVNDFEALFIRTTLLSAVEGASTTKLLSPILHLVKTPEERRADQVLMALSALGNVPEIPGNKLVFLHLVSPHEPYVFSPDGEYVLTQATDPGYPNQIQYLNKRIVSLVKTILEKSSTPPIIILQSDHGRDTEVRMANFEAYYFPKGGQAVLYPTETPINTFRLIFNSYFDQKLPLMPDISYFSPYDDYYNFVKVTYPCNPDH
jgi:hypothetical protein